MNTASFDPEVVPARNPATTGLTDSWLYTLPPEALGDQDCLTAVFTARYSGPGWLDQFGCPTCRVPRGTPCRAAGTGTRARTHAPRQHLIRAVSGAGVPLIGRPQHYGDVVSSRYLFRVYGSRPVLPGASECFPYRVLVSGDPKVSGGSLTQVCPLVVRGDARHGELRPLRQVSAGREMIPPLLMRAIYLAVVTAPDTAMAQQILGTLTADLPGTDFGATQAQDLFALGGGHITPIPVQRSHMTRDGRFTIAGFTEPYPGAWPAHAVHPALHGDLSVLWPCLT